MSSLEIIFIVLLSLVFYTYIGYGVLLFTFVKFKSFFCRIRTSHNSKFEPPVTLFIAAYNEKDCIEDKLQNTLNLDYPKEKVQILFVTDGSDDGTPELLEKHKGITILHQDKRGGKTGAINRGMSFVKNPIVIFSDANAMLNKSAIREIVKHYKNPVIGCVAGEKRIIKTTEDNASGSGEGIYWKYESLLKSMDFKLNTAVGAAGELFSIRTELYEHINENIILDDFIISMKIVEKGYKIAYEPKAFASEAASLSIHEEMKRKIRISAGGIQSIIKLYSLLNVFKFPMLSFQYISHRVLRWSLTPFALFLLMPINFLLIYEMDFSIYHLFFIGQILFYILAIIGWTLEQKKIKVKMVFVPFYFIFMNLCVIVGLSRFLKGNQSVLWEKSMRA